LSAYLLRNPEPHRLNMEVILESLFGLHVTWCAQLYSLAATPPPPPILRIGLVYKGAIAQQRQTTCLCNPLRNPLQTACCGIQELAYDSVNWLTGGQGFGSALI
jgi:hypothetical protein